jgi:protein involved in polysaccharide export with SLBB domain
MNYANIIRKNGMGNRDMMINFSPMSVFEERGDNNIALMARDTIEVFSLDSVSYFPSVEISGEVNRQGIYKFTKDMNVSNLLSYSGGLTANGDLDNIVIIRNSGKEGYDYFSNIEPDKFLLQSDDKVHVFDYAAMNPVQNVQIWGHVKNQGTYVHSKGMSVNDLITLSGGFRNDAMTDSIEVVTGINKNNDVLETSWYSLDEADDIKLHPNDIVFIRRIRDYGKVNYVKILGEVQFPGMYALRENEELSDLLERCGGFTNNAQIKSTQIFRDEVRQKQKVKIKELRDELNNKLQLQMIISGNQDLAGALNIAKFDSIEASGRVILDIDQFGNHEEFYFQDKDSIYVPSISRTILVMGEVNQQTAITFNPNKRKVKYYLDKVGGITATADEDNIYVIKSNGELVRKTGWFSSIYSYELEQGDMVYVPYDYSRVDFLELTKDVTTILYQLSLSAATVYQMSR